MICAVLGSPNLLPYSLSRGKSAHTAQWTSDYTQNFVPLRLSSGLRWSVNVLKHIDSYIASSCKIAGSLGMWLQPLRCSTLIVCTSGSGESYASLATVTVQSFSTTSRVLILVPCIDLAFGKSVVQSRKRHKKIDRTATG